MSKWTSKIKDLGFDSPEIIAEGIDFGVTADVLTIAAIMKVRGIVDWQCSQWHTYVASEHEKNSDQLLQLRLFKELARSVVVRQERYDRAAEYRRSIAWAIKRHLHIEDTSTGNLDDVLQAVRLGMSAAARNTTMSRATMFGMPMLFAGEPRSYKYQGPEGPARGALRNSILMLHRAPDTLAFGVPMELPSRTYVNNPALVVGLATVVDPGWLKAYRPELLELDANIASPNYDENYDQVVHMPIAKVNGIEVGRVPGTPVTDEKVAARVFAYWVYNLMIGHPDYHILHRPCFNREGFEAVVDYNRFQLAQANKLGAGTKIDIGFPHTDEKIGAWFEERLAGSTRLYEVTDLNVLRLPDVQKALAELEAKRTQQREEDELLFQQALSQQGTPGALLFKN